MKLNIYSIQDRQTGAFGTPFFSHNHGTASRSFKQLRDDHNSTVNGAPEDYSLYHLGSFDDQNGEIETDRPQFIVSAVQVGDPKEEILETLKRLNPSKHD